MGNRDGGPEALTALRRYQFGRSECEKEAGRPEVYIDSPDALKVNCLD